MSAEFATASDTTLPLHVLSEDALATWRAEQDASVQAWVEASGFTGGLGQALA